MRRFGLSALLGAAVLLAGIRLEPSPTPDLAADPGSGGSVHRSAPPPVLPAASPQLTAHQLREYLRRSRIPTGHLDLPRLAARIDAAAKANELDPGLLLAVIRVESTFQPYAVSNRGALGLMQILPVTGAELAAELGRRWDGSHTLLEPDLNIDLGARYLRKLLDRFDGDQRAALRAYFVGPTRLEASMAEGTGEGIGEAMGEGLEASVTYADRVVAGLTLHAVLR
jgi:soluble lytic murein transglycosylase